MPGLVFYLLVFLTVGVVFLFFHLMLGHFIRPNRPDDEKMTIYECGEPTVGSAWIQFDLRYYVVALLFVVFDVEVAFFFPWAVVFGKANELSKELPEERRAALTQQLVPAELNLAMLDKAAKQQETTTELPADKDEPAPKKADGAGKKKGAGQGDGKGNGKVGGKKGKGDGAQGPALAQGGPPPGGGPQMSPPPGPTQPVAPPQPIDPIDPVAAKGWAWIAFGDIMIFFGVLMVGFAYLWRRGDINWVRSVAAESEL